MDAVQSRLIRSLYSVLPAWLRDMLDEADELAEEEEENARLPAQVRLKDPRPATVGEWREALCVEPWSFALRTARQRVWRDLMKGDRLQPARR